MAVHLAEDDRIGQPVNRQFMYQCPLFSQSVLMVAHADHHHFGMGFQAGYVFLTRRTEREHEKFGIGLHL